MEKLVTPEVWVFSAVTNSGDEFLALLPKKLTDAEFNAYCAKYYREDFSAGTLNARQILLTEKGVQL